MASSVIEEDLTIEGNIKSGDGIVNVKGKVIGDVTAQSVELQAGGSIDGALSAATISIAGTHQGSLSCEDLKLASTSIVRANVTAKTMATESGAKVTGRIEITGDS